MPALSNAKHETFCQLVAKGETNTKAYLSCGYSKQGAAQSASKLRQKPHIQQRLAELSVTPCESLSRSSSPASAGS